MEPTYAESDEMPTDDSLKQDALDYHASDPPGKVRTVPTKPHATQRDLTLAYSPGVAYPCLAIEDDPENAYKYTAKGNLVAVITNGTAVLGLGNIGPLASKPVMEGKGLLFKTFADIDTFDIEIDCSDTDEFIRTVVNISKTFGGINLEDIKAPECFEIERQIAAQTDIPVMHDDQHGTAIISGAALLNGLEVVQKDIAEVKVVVCGAGASALTCAAYYLRLGVKSENMLVCDSKGIITARRVESGGVNEYKARFARAVPDGDLGSALVDADVLLGLSKGGIVSGEMVTKMAPFPLVFALANPNPEIMPEDVAAVRDDAIVATGRSDYPNQINNVLGFPYIFRGALDVRARDITAGMMMAATMALAALAKEPVTDAVRGAYGGEQMSFGPDYLIPKPFDHRVLMWEATAVAQAAVLEGVAAISAEEFDAQKYSEELEARLGLTYSVMRGVINQASRLRQRIVFPEGNNPTILRAVAELSQEGICIPILLGDAEEIEKMKAESGLKLDCQIINVYEEGPALSRYSEELFQTRKRKGVALSDAKRLLRSRMYYGAMMVRCGDADGFVGGITRHYPDILRPCLEVIGVDPAAHRLVGTYMMTIKGKLMFIGDATINIYPDARTLAEIAMQTAGVARRFGVLPRVAMLSFSNFGSSRAYRSTRIEEAVQIVRELEPDLEIDGPMQADTALVPEIQDEYEFMSLAGPANVLICPNLSSANIAYKLLQRLGDAEMTGPILEGMARPVHVLQRGDGARDVVHMAAICAVDAQMSAQRMESED